MARFGRVWPAFWVAVILAAPAAGQEGAAPDSEALVRIGEGLKDAGRIRITSPQGRLECSGVRVGADGLSFYDAGSSRLSQPRTLVAWSEIAELETGRTSMKRGVMIGALCGVAAWLVSGRGEPTQDSFGIIRAAEVSVERLVATVAVGTAVGALVGHMHVRWTRIHPVEPQ